ncbi:MAG TPA: type II toxin-antitoxin system HicA family toxin [Herpetosiphonaceae bacterium]|nr:type II toxin-antitoxin system HicA family toxin [Herpetosiphonaceae bacterium]
MIDDPLNDEPNNRVLYRHIQQAYEYINKLPSDPTDDNSSSLTQLFHARLLSVLELEPSEDDSIPGDLSELRAWTGNALRQRVDDLIVGQIDEIRLDRSVLENFMSAPNPHRVDGREDEVWARSSTLGVEAYAVYLPIHFFFDASQFSTSWGVYIMEDGIRRLAEALSTAFGEIGWCHHLDHLTVSEIAYQVLLRHELAHFRFEAWALNAELFLGKAIYVPYMTNVYAATFPGVECLEEAVANNTVLNSTAISNLVKKNTPPDVPYTCTWQATIAAHFFDRQPPCYQNYRLGDGWPRSRSIGANEREEAINHLCNQILRASTDPPDVAVPFYAFPPDNYFLRAEKLVPIHIVPTKGTSMSIFKFATPTRRDFTAFLKELGYAHQRTKGSHQHYKSRLGWPSLTLDHHSKEIGPGAYKDTLKKLGISKADYDHYRFTRELPPALRQRLLDSRPASSYR